MSTVHIESNEHDIAEVVLMPGDPLRAKYIAENYLSDYKVINNVRGMLGYTGFYNGKRVSVMASGMGMPSVTIYAYELFKFYNVESIIRIGTCGAGNKDVNINDIILSDKAYTLANFAYLHNGDESNEEVASDELNKKILKTAQDNNIELLYGNIYTSLFFDLYLDDRTKEIIPDYMNILGREMEGFALLHLANDMNKKATVLLTVVDSMFRKEKLTSMERQTALDKMIKLALDSI